MPVLCIKINKHPLLSAFLLLTADDMGYDYNDDDQHDGPPEILK